MGKGGLRREGRGGGLNGPSAEAGGDARASTDAAFAAWVLGPAARVPKLSTRAGLQAVLFDLDGVLVDTVEFHYQAWQRLAGELGLPFDRQRNHAFRGVGRGECLELLLGEHAECFVTQEKQLLAERKNAYYLEQVMRLTPEDLAEGVQGLAMGLRAMSDGGGEGGVRLAVVSASRNCRTVLKKLQIEDWFDVVVDGADVTRGKPDPQGFLLTAERLRVRAAQCVVGGGCGGGPEGGAGGGDGVRGGWRWRGSGGKRCAC